VLGILCFHVVLVQGWYSCDLELEHVKWLLDAKVYDVVVVEVVDGAVDGKVSRAVDGEAVLVVDGDVKRAVDCG